LLDADRVPVAEGDLSMRAAADDRRRAALLLAAVDPVRELVVGADVIKLRGWLIIPGRPGLAAVDRDDRALVAGQEDDPRVVGVDPEGVIVVAAGGALEVREGPAAVLGAVGRRVGHVDDFLVLRIDLDLREVGAAAPQPALAVDALPALARIIRAVDAAVARGIDDAL